MPVSACPCCGKGTLIPDELLGQTVKCPHCASPFLAGNGPAPAGPPAAGPSVLATCPSCAKQCRVFATMAGRSVRCPSCEKPFVVPRGAAPAPPVPVLPAADPTPVGAPIRFSCPRCEHGLNVPSTMAGNKIPCPSCGQRLQVPVPVDPDRDPAVMKTLLGRVKGATEPEAPPAAKRELFIEEGPDKDKVFPLPDKGTLKIGRAADADVQLKDLKVSRKHCELDVTDDGLVLRDVKTEQGTYLNGERITQKPVQVGDVIQVGATRLLVKGDMAEQKTIQGGNLQEILKEEMRRRGLAPTEETPGGPPEETIEVMCPQCNQKLVARAKYAGTRVRCPVCDEFVNLPGKASRVLSPPDATAPALAPATGRPLSQWLAYGAAILLGLALIGTLAGVLLATRGR